MFAADIQLNVWRAHAQLLEEEGRQGVIGLLSSVNHDLLDTGVLKYRLETGATSMN